MRWTRVGAAVLVVGGLVAVPALPAASEPLRPSAALAPQSVTFTSSVRVPLSSSWRITSTTQLRAYGTRRVSAAPAIRCVVRSLVRVSGRPATAAWVRCTGPVGAPGRPYRVTLKRPTSSATLTYRNVTFAQPTFATTSALVAAAPLPALQGVMESHGGVGFLHPSGWARTDFDDAVLLEAASGSDRCDVYVFHPVAADTSSVNASLYAQLFGTVQGLFGATPVTGEFGEAYLYRRQAGATGYGSPWVGLTLQAGGTDDVQAYLVRFGTQAVQVVLHSKAWSGCDHNGPFSGELAQLFHTLSVPGASAATSGFPTRILGEWELITTSMGALYAFGANGHYDTVTGTSWPVSIGGVLYDRTTAWFGAGSYVLRGPILATFPASGAPPSSSLIRIYSEVEGSVSSTRLCETFTYEGSIGEACWKRSA